MSLITEALKRAQNPTDQQPSAQPPPLIITPRPENRFVEVPQERNQRPRSGLLTMIVLVAVLVVVAGAAWARIWLLRKAPRERTPIPVAAKAARGRTSEAAAPAADTPAKPQVAVSKPAQATPVTRPLENVKTEQVAAAPVPSPALEPPKLTLQGIMSEGQDREAVINGVSVRVGDNLEGARVTAIDARNVRLQFGEHEIVLRLQ